MKRVLIVSGLSGSGKSTFAQQYVMDHPNWLRLNRDDLRRSMLPVSLSDYWTTWPEREIDRLETVVNEAQKTALLEGLKRGWHILIDNTNLKLSYFNEFRQLLSSHFDKVEIRYQLIDTPIDECIRRDQNRADSVGAELIRRQAEQLAILKKKFTFQSEMLTQNPVFRRVQDESLPRCVLIDIDGTVAKRGDRSPFDWRRVGVDTPNWPVIRLVQSLKTADYTIIFLSGRDAICRPETTGWLNYYFGWQSEDYQLFMRPERNNQKDSIIKQDLFAQHIVGNYYVEFVIDDRQQVVDMWRRTLGLTCIQVDYGDF